MFCWFLQQARVEPMTKTAARVLASFGLVMCLTASVVACMGVDDSARAHRPPTAANPTVVAPTSDMSVSGPTPQPGRPGSGALTGAGPSPGTSSAPGTMPAAPSPAVGASAGKSGSATVPDSMAPLEQGNQTAPGFNMEASLQAFTSSVYPVLREHCGRCHSTDGTGQLPMHADVDPAIAHQFALTRVNLRQVPASRLVQRQGVEGHHCWSNDCKADSALMQQKVQQWADAVKPYLATSTLPVPDSPVTEEQVLQWIAQDKATIAASDAPFIKYASLHRLQNMTPTPTFDDMNTARAGISKILNSTARYASAIVNPVAIDPYNLVYRFDIRAYWGYRRPVSFFGAGQVTKDPTRATEIWNRVVQGNINADDLNSNNDTPIDSRAKDTPTFPNIAGFFPDYVDATQLGYTLSRPDVYNEIMSLPPNSALLESELGVDISKGTGSWTFVTVDDAITINKRMLLRAPIRDGFFWKGVDPFAQSPFIFYDRPVPEMDGFSLVKTTPVFASDGTYSQSNGLTTDKDGNLVGGPQAQASEMIYSLPNGLQGYMVGGAVNQIRVDAFPFIVVDPRRGGPLPNGPLPFRFGAGAEQRLLIPASCMSCHVDGMNRTNDNMRPYIDANPGKFDAATVDEVKALFPGTAWVRDTIEKDREPFAKAMAQIRGGMIVGIADKSVYVEPIMYLFEHAQTIFNYKPTASN